MKSIISCKECKTRSCFVQQFCSPEWIDRIDSSKNQVLYKKGQHIFREGDRVFGFYILQKGKVKVISTGRYRKEQIVRLASDGHVVGHRGYGSETYPVGAVALEDTLACFVDNEILYDAFMKNPRFTYALMMFYAFELRKTEIRGRHMAQMTIKEKVAYSLLYIKEMFGMNTKDHSLSLILTRKELADVAGTSPEQVTRELTELEAEGLIKKEGRKIIFLSFKGLNNLIAGHETLEYAESWKKFDAEFLNLP